MTGITITLTTALSLLGLAIAFFYMKKVTSIPLDLGLEEKDAKRLKFIHGAIAQGALVAEAMGLPFVYIRTESKKHGLTNLIEGHIEAGQSVVVVEDLISTGGSSLKAVNALREAKCDVKGMVAIFSYQLPIATENFKKEKCKLITLADYDTMIGRAAENKYIRESDMASLSEWRKDPKKWAEKFI